MKVKDELESILQNQSVNSQWIEHFKVYQNIDTLDRRMVVTLIERILVYEDYRLQIEFRYQADYEHALAMIQASGVKEAV